MRPVFTLFTLWLALLVSGPARATVYDIYPNDDLFTRLASLQAGDEVIVHAGTYARSGPYEVTWDGTPGAPIIVRAAAGDTPLVDCAAGQNIINIRGSHFELRGIEFTGGSHGIRLYDVHDALLEDLHIHDTDEVGLSANIDGNEYYHLTFRRLHIHHTGGHGEGMYLGCNGAGCIFRENLIEGCWVHDTNHGTAQGDGIEIKQGSWGNVVRNNVIHDTQYPCILVYGTQGNAVNVVENNVVWSCADSGIQAASDAIVQNNLVYDVGGNGIMSMPHDGAIPGNLTIVHNTVVTCGDRCLRGNEWGGKTGIRVANNVFYNAGGNAIRIGGGDSTITMSQNLVLGGLDGVSGGTVTGNSAAADFVDVASFDFWPTNGSPVIDQGDSTVGVTVDFNWTTRDANPDIGAYEWTTSGNPGWDVEPGFRVDPDGGVPPLTDAAVLMDGAPTDPDAAAEDPDSGTPPEADASPVADAGGPPAGDDGGCGCRTGASPEGAWVGALVLLCWLVRRRRF